MEIILFFYKKNRETPEKRSIRWRL